MSSNISNYSLFKWFIIEEYRVLSDLFGKKRLLLFPLMLFIVSLILGLGVPLFEFDSRMAPMILFGILILFGIQTGSLGFEARDMIDNLLGDTSRILYSSRTLPITRSKLASVFLVKDALIYTAVMLIPIVTGTIIGVAFSPIEGGFDHTITLTGLISLYVLSIMSFVFGSSLGFMLTTINIKKLRTLIITIGASIGVLVLFFYYNVGISDIIEINPLIAILGLFLGTILSSLVGIWQFRIVSESEESSQHHNYYNYIPERFTKKSSVMNVFFKSFIDIIRSPGGFWKIIFSTGIIAITVVFLVTVVNEFMNTMMREEFLYIGLFSLGVFPIYSLVYRYDSDKHYSIHPIKELNVRLSKVILYMILSYVIVSLFYLVMTVGEIGLYNLIYGLLLLPFLLVYQLGIFMAVAKDQPMKFLFNGALFGIYGISMMFVIVPVVMVGLFGMALPEWFVIMTVMLIVISGLVGIVLTYLGVRGYFYKLS